MNINDLETCEVVEFENQIIGGAQTYVRGKAKAKPGKANAYVVALASGDNTSTNAKTGVVTSPYYGVAYSVGNAAARKGTKFSYVTGFDVAFASKAY